MSKHLGSVSKQWGAALTKDEWDQVLRLASEVNELPREVAKEMSKWKFTYSIG